MSELERIKARASEPDKVLEWTNPYADEYLGALQRSQADVLPLVTALEAVLGIHQEDIWRGHSNGCKVCGHTPEGLPFPCKTVQTIKEALQ